MVSDRFDDIDHLRSDAVIFGEFESVDLVSGDSETKCALRVLQRPESEGTHYSSIIGRNPCKGLRSCQRESIEILELK